MQSYIVNGGEKVEGEIKSSGSKNSSLPILAATILNKGTTLYLPVQVEGAKLITGDVHALQGNGEVLASLEIPAKITLKVELIKGENYLEL